MPLNSSQFGAQFAQMPPCVGIVGLLVRACRLEDVEEFSGPQPIAQHEAKDRLGAFLLRVQRQWISGALVVVLSGLCSIPFALLAYALLEGIGAVAGWDEAGVIGWLKVSAILWLPLGAGLGFPLVRATLDAGPISAKHAPHA